MAHNRLIFKNTIYMAMRMLISMAVTLYTSRVVLQQLGVDNFGIYTVVGGLAVIMSFFTSALTAAIQRYMNVELASSSSRDGMQGVFSACWGCVLSMAILFVILAEGAGLWFLNNELNIAPDRMADARIVFQMSLVIVVLEMIRVPYNSLIIAHERMSFYAYNSIVEVGLKLATAILLALTPGNKLLVYMAMLIAVAALINLSYIVYCRHILPELRFSLRADRRKMLEIGRFAGWNVLTSASDIAYQQGTSMILNIFYGVALNASMGIATQVKFAVSSFTRSVQIAANPQLIKTFAAGETEEFARLFVRISRVSFYLMAFLGVPLLLNTDFVLSTWLTVIPPMGITFVRLMILFCILDSLSGPLWVSMQASGNIALYQIVISIIWTLSIPLTWLAFHFHLPGYWVLVVMIAINVTLIAIRVGFTSRHCGITASRYFKQIVVNIAAVTACAAAIPAVVTATARLSPLAMFLVTGTLWVVTMPASIYLIGLSSEERSIVKTFIKKRLKS